MNTELARAVDKRPHLGLAISAHELGHALAAKPHGLDTVEVRLETGLFGGVNGGYCSWDIDDHMADRPRQQQLGHLIGLMAGQAAQIRFCQLYLDMSASAALSYGRGPASADHRNFGKWQRFYGLTRYSQRWAYNQAVSAINQQGDRIDRLTVRLERAKRLTGHQL